MNARRNESVLLEALVTVTDLLLTDIETQALMERMVQVAASALPDVGSASVTVQVGNSGSTLAASDAVAVHIDEAQYAGNVGPCLQALRTGKEVHVPELTTSPWPAVAAAARRQGVGASLSVPLRNGEVGVLNLYARQAGVFGDEGLQEDSRTFARYAATIIAAHSRFQEAVTEAQQLHEALESRAMIEQAKGIIVAREQCTPDEAFKLLVRTSQHSHHKLRDIAASLVASAARPLDAD